MCKQIFKYLLQKGLVWSVLTINFISYIILAVAMYVLNWYHKHH
jgi:hypothetical protein